MSLACLPTRRGSPRCFRACKLIERGSNLRPSLSGGDLSGDEGVRLAREQHALDDLPVLVHAHATAWLGVVVASSASKQMAQASGHSDALDAGTHRTRWRTVCEWPVHSRRSI